MHRLAHAQFMRSLRARPLENPHGESVVDYTRRMTKNTLTTLTLAAAAGILASCNSTPDKSKESATPAAAETARVPAPPLTVEDSARVIVTAKVKSINYVTREVTLQDDAGRSTSFVAGPEVRRLNEVAVGDEVTANFVVSVEAELRPPTADEAANPISAVEVSGRSPRGTDPAMAAARGARVVTTVEAIDIPNMRVTLKGPMGDSTTVKARKLENIKQLKVGDTIIITYFEAMGVSLDKTPVR